MNKIKSLDGLRGAAALCVFFSHIGNITETNSSHFLTWLFFQAGHEAVILFFVLSGFVLTLSNESYKGYTSYVIKRLFRIYPAYWLSIIIGILSFIIIKPHKITIYSDWFNYQFPSILISKQLLLDSIFLIPHSGSIINGAAWSLTYEITVSLFILPIMFKYKSWFVKDYKVKIIYWACLVSGSNKVLVIPIIILFINLMQNRHKLRSVNYLFQFGIASIVLLFYVFYNQGHFSGLSIINKILSNFYKSFHYALYFYIGFMAYHKKNNLIKISSVKLFPLYVMLFASQFFSFGFINNLAINELLSAFGAFGFISCCLYNDKIQSFFENKIVYFYGKISYSFYLLHMPILYIAIYLLRNKVNLLEIKIIIFLTTTCVSYFVYKLVEVRFIRLGNFFTNRL